jgi:hypothetical protein
MAVKISAATAKLQWQSIGQPICLVSSCIVLPDMVGLPLLQKQAGSPRLLRAVTIAQLGKIECEAVHRQRIFSAIVRQHGRGRTQWPGARKCSVPAITAAGSRPLRTRRSMSLKLKRRHGGVFCHVRFSPNTGHWSGPPACPKSANNGNGLPHSITSSAATRSVSGTVRPSALAALRLMTSRYIVGC